MAQGLDTVLDYSSSKKRQHTTLPELQNYQPNESLEQCHATCNSRQASKPGRTDPGRGTSMFQITEEYCWTDIQFTVKHIDWNTRSSSFMVSSASRKRSIVSSMMASGEPLKNKTATTGWLKSSVVVWWTTSAVLLKGSVGDFFWTTVGVRQGCPLYTLY